jgi:hypothetical protein
MGVKLGLATQGKNIEGVFECVWEQGARENIGSKWEEDRQKYIMRSFIIVLFTTY